MTRLALDSPASVAEEASLAALLRCCVREIAGPRGQVGHEWPYVLLRVAGTPLRVRAYGGLALRFDGRAERLENGSWQPLSAERLVRLVESELGEDNDEFASQVAESRDVMTTLLAARQDTPPPADPWLASEQALVLGHPFHPSPKARGGDGWLRYAPEAHASFPLRLLGVRRDVLAGAGDTSCLDALGQAPPGYALLPAHPWQLELLAADLAAPLADGRLVDLGESSRRAVPTSSVRTVYEPLIDRCLKFSLDVRITNCLRKNSWYELAGAVELSRRLGPVFRDLADDFPGTRWLPEPGYRSAALGTRLLEGLGVIVRVGPWSVCTPGVTPLLSGALAAAGHPVADPVGWWRAYVERVAPPVLDAYLGHGVVLEPHLQNVLIGVDAAGLPVEAVFRDLEGTKLVAGRHDLSGLPGRVAEALTYDPAAGWDRVVYCLMVNHLPEIAASLAGPGFGNEHGNGHGNGHGAGHGPVAAHTPGDAAATGRGRPAGNGNGNGSTAGHGSGLERELWAVAREVLAGYAASRGWPRRMTDLLSGRPLPAKANLSVRWARSADRSAGYVPVANPLAPS